MRKLIVILMIILLLPLTVHAYKFAENWTKADTAYQGVVITALAVDMAQTLYISENPNEYSEMNPLLGKHPSQDKVIGYFLGGMIAHTAVAMALPPTYRRIWQYVFIGVETLVIGRNYSIGVGTDF